MNALIVTLVETSIPQSSQALVLIAIVIAWLAILAFLVFVLSSLPEFLGP